MSYWSSGKSPDYKRKVSKNIVQTEQVLCTDVFKNMYACMYVTKMIKNINLKKEGYMRGFGGKEEKRK